jgi:excisionase family DNA binding protein
MARRWTEEEEFLLESLAGELPVQEIAKRLKRNRNAVEMKAFRMNLSIQTETDNWSITALAKLLNVNPSTVFEWIAKGHLGGQKVGRSRTSSYKISKKEFKLFYETYGPRKQSLKRLDPGIINFLIN